MQKITFNFIKLIISFFTLLAIYLQSVSVVNTTKGIEISEFKGTINVMAWTEHDTASAGIGG